MTSRWNISGSPRFVAADLADLEGGTWSTKVRSDLRKTDVSRLRRPGHPHDRRPSAGDPELASLAEA